jgi:hypothetical protein
LILQLGDIFFVAVDHFLKGRLDASQLRDYLVVIWSLVGFLGISIRVLIQSIFSFSFWSLDEFTTVEWCTGGLIRFAD